MDFDAIGSSTVTFPSHSISGEIQCVTVELLNDRRIEGPENFVAHLSTNDSAMTVDQDRDVTIITIYNILDPNG